MPRQGVLERLTVNSEQKLLRVHAVPTSLPSLGVSGSVPSPMGYRAVCSRRRECDPRSAPTAGEQRSEVREVVGQELVQPEPCSSEPEMGRLAVDPGHAENSELPALQLQELA